MYQPLNQWLSMMPPVNRINKLHPVSPLKANYSYQMLPHSSLLRKDLMFFRPDKNHLWICSFSYRKFQCKAPSKDTLRWYTKSQYHLHSFVLLLNFPQMKILTSPLYHINLAFETNFLQNYVDKRLFFLYHTVKYPENNVNYRTCNINVSYIKSGEINNFYINKIHHKLIHHPIN